MDNNSSDETVKLAKEYKFIRVLSEKKQGIFYARGRGFDNASSDIIGRIDADTILSETWVQKVKEYYEAPDCPGAAITGCGSFRNVNGVPNWLNFGMQDLITFHFNRYILGHHVLWGSNMALTKRQWEQVKPELCEDNDIHEDLDIAIHLHRQGERIDYRKELVVSVIMKRIFDDYSKLWPNLMWWPNTLRKHHNPKWVLGFFGALFLFANSLWIKPINFLAKKLKKAKTVFALQKS